MDRVLVKPILLLCLVLCSALQLQAQKKQAVFLEILGSSSLVGVHYDARFNNHTKWGYRAGLAFSFSKTTINFMGQYNEQTAAWMVPLAVNYLLGNKKHAFEMGLGVNQGVYRLKATYQGAKYTERKYEAFAFMDLGYRLQTRRGFLFRVGLTPAVGLSSKFKGDKNFALAPYLSFGYCF